MFHDHTHAHTFNAETIESRLLLRWCRVCIGVTGSFSISVFECISRTCTVIVSAFGLMNDTMGCASKSTYMFLRHKASEHIRFLLNSFKIRRLLDTMQYDDAATLE